ncbi:MAG: PSD1 and planctomycete cytochrome C domain-containing protein [Gemmataceae bacterium]|nr:PSD1 and planctomycete cytochrome C domain-containing protein [Gemmataceae bacterium]
MRWLCSLIFTATLVGAASAKDVDFNRDVRPILASKCFQCHGFDDGARKAGLRLDVRDAALKELKSGTIAIVPGKPDESELVARIVHANERKVMPPPKTAKRLTDAEVATLKQWIGQGAPYAVHWAFVKPVRLAPPDVRDKQWSINGIDRFILARLEKEGLRPTPVADRYALIRRVAIDLTGLPPTIEQAEAAYNDKAADWYEKYVDRLLASPAFGERWAQLWLDQARYADSQGFANDPDRTIWRYRDWVIQAHNDNLPFDRFTIDQLAGDLLPNPTPAQLIATGFHRNTLTNTEGGTNAEEFRSAAVVDRVNTTFQVWMAGTLACAQCHSHKYDPYTQKEYYQLYAIFNNTEDNNSGSDAPTLTTAVVGMEKEFDALTPIVAGLKKRLDELTGMVDAGQLEWELSVDSATLPKDIAAILAQPADKRDKNLLPKLNAYYRNLSEPWKDLNAEFIKVDGRLKQISATTPVLREGKPRVTNIHIRGDFLAKGDLVKPGLPAVFPPAPANEPMNRLTLAKWLVSPENPLTARVAVNRYWEQLFGIGIVETSEDFGMQGEAPSHPELLDWLATEYIRLGWDTKQMLRLMVTSAAYRQGAQVTEELTKRDPFNRLLARGPRVRLTGEAIRDQALFVSGLMSTKMYGKPVQPPRPSFGLSAAFGGSTDWTADTDENRFRRGLYIRWRRNAPYPSLTTFDAPERTVCTTRRSRTNTPLQALVTLNDPVFVETAQGLARRIMSQGGASMEARIAYGFRLCLTRPPSEKETQRLAELFAKVKEQYSGNLPKATAMATKPLGPAPRDMDIVDLAAWTVISNVLLNLDETLSKR